MFLNQFLRYDTANDESTTSTQSTTPVDKVTLSAIDLTAGIYKVSYYCELTLTANNRNAAAQLVQTTGGSNNVICKYSKERKDGDDNDGVCGFGFVTIPDGDQEFKLQFFREGGGGSATVSCSRARIFLQKIR